MILKIEHNTQYTEGSPGKPGSSYVELSMRKQQEGLQRMLNLGGRIKAAEGEGSSTCIEVVWR